MSMRSYLNTRVHPSLFLLYGSFVSLASLIISAIVIVEPGLILVTAVIIFTFSLAAFIFLTSAPNQVFITKQRAARHNVKPTFTTPLRDLVLAFLIAWLTVTFLTTAYQTTLAPAIAWDTVSYWAASAETYLDVNLPANSQPTPIPPLHPPTVGALHASGRYLSLWLGFDNSPFIYYGAVYGLMLTGMFGYAWAMTGNVFFATIPCLIIATNPLLESHVALSGYSEIWVTICIFYTIAFLTLIDYSRYPILPSFLAAAAAITLPFLKAAGLSYLLVILMSLILARLITYRQRLYVALAIIIMIATVLFTSKFGFNFNILGFETSYDPSQKSILFGRYRGDLSFKNWALIISNLEHAFVIKSTHAVMLFPFLVGCVVLIRSAFKPVCFAQVFPIIVSVGLFTHLYISQEIGGTFILFSTPDRDTSLTRFSMSWFVCVAIVLVSLFQRANQMNTNVLRST